MLRFNAKNYISLGLILMLLILFHYIGWLRPIERFTRSLFTPISAAINGWRIDSFESYRYFKERNDILERLRRAEEREADFKTAEAHYIVLEQENEELRRQLGFQERTAYSMKPARVVGRNADGTEKMIIINIGKTEGVILQQPVIVGDGILVGTVAKVENDIAMVRLINDNQSKIAATLLNKEKSPGVVEGGYGLSIRMNLIPRNEVVLVGDKVITSGFESHIPRGLLIGEVAVAENEAYQPFQQAVLSPPVDLSKLFIVSVLMSTSTP